MSTSTVVQRISKKTQSLTRQLTRLRQGPCSISLPKNVKQVEMHFAMRNRDYGARRFLKNDIPSLLYTNPNIAFKQERPEKIPNPKLIVTYDDGNSTTINLKEKSHESILSEFTSLFNASSSSSSSSSSIPIPTSRPHPASSSSTTTSTTRTESSNIKPASIATPPQPPSSGEVEAGVDVGTARQ